MREWTRASGGPKHLVIPAHNAPTCQWPEPRMGYLCTRAEYHSGRHAATGTGWVVLAVWENEMEPAR